jgi:hypothetical protein
MNEAESPVAEDSNEKKAEETAQRQEKKTKKHRTWVPIMFNKNKTAKVELRGRAV